MESSRLILSRIRAAYLVGALLLVGGPATAQDLAASLPLDLAIRTGTLPNGITFFIRHNALPDDRVMLRLAVKAGSVDEADDQRGLAHVLEHMAFNGTTHFKPGELVTYLESIGARFGAARQRLHELRRDGLHARRADRASPASLERGFEALSDFAGGMTLDPVEIDKERGVVIEEWRGRLGAGTRMQEPQMEALFGASRYIDRLPIGTPEILKSFPAQRLRDFYQRNYRPDRMAVIVVGDIEVGGGRGARPEELPGMPSRPARRARCTDPVASGDALRLGRRTGSAGVVGDRDVQASAHRAADDRRLPAVAGGRPRVPDDQRPVRRDRAAAGRAVPGRVGRRRHARPDGRGVLGVGAREGRRHRAGLSAMTQEMARVRQFGFGEAELDRAKRSTLAGYERAYNERDKSQSGPLAAELVRHYLNAEAAPGIESEVDLRPEIPRHDHHGGAGRRWRAR